MVSKTCRQAVVAVVPLLHGLVAQVALAQDIGPATEARSVQAPDPAAVETRHIPAPDRLAAVDLFVADARARLGLPGLAIAIATPDSVVFATGYGGASTGERITGRTPIHIGSVTKTVTAAVAVRLAGEGRLDLDAPVERYLPSFSMQSPFTPGSITLRNLLEHRSGLSQWSGHDGRAQREGRFGHLAPRGPPGERAEYSSLNFIILGRVLEAASGESYAGLVRGVLFDPLGMHDAFVDGPGGTRPADLAPGHQSWFGFQRRRSEPVPPRYLVPAGFVGASAHDLGRYGGMLVGRGAFGATRILDPESAVELLGPLDGGVGRALSWGRRRVDDRLVLEHSGNTRTSAARLRLLPEEGLALVVLANTNSGPFFDAADAVLDGMDAILAGAPAPSLWPMERIFKGVVLAGTALAVVGMGRKAVAWSRAGYPTALDGSAGTLGRLGLDLGLGAAVLFGIPRLVGVPLSTMIEYFPDLGIGIVASAGAGVAGGVLHAFTRSAAGR